MSIKPVRLQRKRTKGFKLVSPNGLENILVCRSKFNVFGNPYKIGGVYMDNNGIPKEITREISLQLFQNRELSRPSYIKKVKQVLKGKNLVCWCSLNQPCHADLLLKIANEE